MLYCADINECAVRNGNCPAESTCVNNVGSYVCVCESGYRREGARCVGQLQDIYPTFADADTIIICDKNGVYGFYIL